MKEKTFDEFWEELKNESPETRRELEVMEDCSSVIRQLVVARVDGGLTQKELAAKCGLTQSAIARMEKMQAMPRLDTLITVAKALNLSLSINNSLRLHTNYSARKNDGQYRVSKNKLFSVPFNVSLSRQSAC
jgi:transcriptional regulator with XRE-family HTH domain